MKWSAYQLRVIEALKQGAVLHFMTGLHAHWFLSINFKPRPSDATAQKLIKAGVVKRHKSDWRGSSWKYANPPHLTGAEEG